MSSRKVEALLKKWVYPPALIFFPLSIGTLIGYFAQSAKDPWYQMLIKPSWNPPPWLFGPIWSLLYLLMGTASWRIWRWRERCQGPSDRALTLHALQLLLNFIWTPLFFFFHRPLWALFDIVALIITLSATGISFYRLDKAAGLMLLPYWTWLLLAAMLNWRLIQLNGG